MFFLNFGPPGRSMALTGLSLSSAWTRDTNHNLWYCRIRRLEAYGRLGSIVAVSTLPGFLAFC